MQTLTRAALVLFAAEAVSLPVRAADPDPAELAKQAEQILKTNCHRCHGQDGANEGGFNFVLDRQQLVNRKKIVPGDVKRSKLFQRVVSDDNPMPPDEEKTRPSKDDLALLKRWVEAGAPDFRATVPERKPVTPADVVQAIRDDLGKVAERDRRFTRYFTLAHLYNAGLSADELQSYRHGLAKLVNSLSWGPRVVVPRPVDAAATVFRIDLRDCQWNEKVWDAVLAANPYGVRLTTGAATFCAEATRCRMPYVRGDWFVAAAARPPLYHEILQLPGTDRELEKLLRVDVEEDVRQERVARTGFNGSGVSRNNRLIERHESGSVVYWKSYDFTSNTGRHNLFAHPLGPGDAEHLFTQDGGEIIFSLPNGLQAYLLVDGRGRRIDKGPTAVVSDPKRPDRAVENGLSCMSCHAKGMIEKNDQVRDHVLQNPGAFTRADVETVKALYPPKEPFAELVRKDARRFQEAVAKTGAPLSATEPIAALALRFEAEMDLPLVAAEAGVSPQEVLKALDRSAALAQQLGPLKVEGGTVQRQVFVDAFADLVGELKLGEFLPPRGAALARLLRQAERLAETGDADGALRAFAEAIRLEPESPLPLIGRGDLHRERGEYGKALADYTEAIRLDPQSALAFNNRGLAYKRTGDLERAVADYTEAIRVNPRFAVAFYNRGAAHQARGDLDKAITDYTEAIRLDPQSAAFYSNRGYVHLEKGELDKALADCDQALRLQPRFAFALNNRGLAYSRKGELDKAVADFTAAIEIDPNFAKAYFNRALAYEKKGDKARAKSDREKALRLDPSLDKDER